MTPDASKSDDDDVSPAGKVYREMVSDMLAAERDRRTNLEGRAGILFASSGTLLALVGGLAAFVVGKDHAFENRTAIIELCKALPWFVLSAVTALVVQTKGWPYPVVNRESLAKIAGTDDFWEVSADFAARVDVDQQAKTIDSLRRGNNDMVMWILVSLMFQIIAIVLLSAAVGFELWARLNGVTSH
jgi:hypothetical protein